ncbi:MAG: porin [Saprospiraceae bacterium]
MTNKFFFIIIGVLLLVRTSTYAQDAPAEDHSYKPLTIKLNDTGSKYIRFIVWHQQWVETNNLAVKDSKLQLNTFARRSRFLAYAQISPKFLILTHFGLNNLNSSNLTSLGNNGDGPQIFLHDAWTEYRLIDKKLYVGTGLHYWKGLTRLANASTLNFMTMDQARPFSSWHSLGVTDQFARHFGIYAKGQIGKFDYRLAINNPLNPANSINAGKDYSRDSLGVGWTYTGKNVANTDKKPTGNTVIEGYFRYNFWDTESTLLPYQVGSYLGSKKVFGVGVGFFAHPNGMYNTVTQEHGNVMHLAADAYLDMPLTTGDCLSAYASFTNFNYGENFVSRWAGTGNVLYAQVGYKFSNSKFMPYLALQNGQYDGYSDPLTGLDVGLNYFINGHNAKLTLEYHNLSGEYRDNPIDGKVQQIRLQSHIFL